MVQDDRKMRKFAEHLAERFPEYRPLRQVIHLTHPLRPPGDFFAKKWRPFPRLSHTAQEYIALSVELERRLMQGRKFRAKALADRQ
jgi:hypothetical protein